MALILIATANPGKQLELQRLLPNEHRVVTLGDLGLSSPEETGSTLAANAAMKALTGNAASGLLTIADDTGLEVDALEGAPGVRSARFAGEPPDDRRNVAKLLALLAGKPREERTAQFRCVVAAAYNGAVVHLQDGNCRGWILDEPRGANGFGYDPVFLLANDRTLAELSLEEKNRVSHRAAALTAMVPALRELAESIDASEPSR